MPNLRTGLVVTVLSVLSTTAAPQGSDCTESAEIVCIEQGPIRGMIEGQTLAFKGIPYAQPPVGPLRWKPPQPAERWGSVRDGSRYGAMCPQFVGQEVKGEEDCLYVNVWRPREKPDRPLPVMVWLT
jgi:para-nitrobenzyl esterase